MQENKRPADRIAYEERLRNALKFLSYAPIVFVSASTGKGTDKIFPTLEEVARERRKRVGTGEMNRFLKHVDFERASVPARQRVKIFYMTQAGGRAANFCDLHRSKSKVALCLPALSGKSDSRGFRISRHSNLDQEPRPRLMKNSIRNFGWRCSLCKHNPTPCHSDARFIGEESAFCRRRHSRFLAPQTALRNDNPLGK